MTLTYLGSESIGQIIPQAGTLVPLLLGNLGSDTSAQATVASAAGLPFISTFLANVATALTNAQTIASAAQIDVFTFAGPVDNLGGELASTLANGAPSGGQPGDACNAYVLVTRDAPTWAQLAAVFTPIASTLVPTLTWLQSSQTVAQAVALAKDVVEVIVTAEQTQAQPDTIDAFTYSGPVDGLGTVVTVALQNGAPSGGTGSTSANAVVMLTRNAATWTAMQAVFGGG